MYEKNIVVPWGQYLNSGSLCSVPNTLALKQLTGIYAQKFLPGYSTFSKKQYFIRIELFFKGLHPFCNFFLSRFYFQSDGMPPLFYYKIHFLVSMSPVIYLKTRLLSLIYQMGA